MKIKTRVTLRHFMSKKDGDGKQSILTSAFIVECCVNKTWSPVGDENGIVKYKTRPEAEEAAKALASKEVEVA